MCPRPIGIGLRAGGGGPAGQPGRRGVDLDCGLQPSHSPGVPQRGRQHCQTGNVTANLAALAGGNDANNRLKTITADNFDATIAAVGGRLYPRADNPNRTVYLGGEPMELHKLWENEAGQGGGAFTDNEKAQVAERLRDWSESGYLTFNKPPEGPDVTVIRLPRLEPVAGTPISFAAKRQRIRSFEREVAQAQADGKFIIVEQPKSTRERYADLGEYVIPGFGFIRADRQATDPDGPGGQHITPAEFKHIALEAMLAPVEFLPAPVGGAFKLGGKAIVKLGGEVATNVPSIVRHRFACHDRATRVRCIQSGPRSRRA